MGEGTPTVKAGQVKKIKAKPLSPEKTQELDAKLPGLADTYLTIENAKKFIKPLENQDTAGAAKLEAETDKNEQTIVGWGSRADDLKPGDKITEAEADKRLGKDIATSIQALKRTWGEDFWNRLTMEERESLLSTMHNVGNFGTMWKKDDIGLTPTKFMKAVFLGDEETAGKENDFGKEPGHEVRRRKENERAKRPSK